MRPWTVGYFFFQAEDGIRYLYVTGVQTCALPISHGRIQNAYEMWSFSGSEVLEGVLRGWFTNGGGPVDLVRLDGPDDLRSEERRVGKEGRSRGRREHEI